MENREITDEPYRYGYQGKFSEKDATTGQQEFQLRNYDARIGRWLVPDPEGQFASPYLAMGNTPHMSVDPTGGLSGPCPPLCPEIVATGSLAGSSIGTAIEMTAGYVAEISASRLASSFVLPSLVNLSLSAFKFTPLTTQNLRQIAVDEGVSPAMPRFNQIVGAAFEDAALSSFGLVKNTQPFQTPGRAARGGLLTTIPDGVRDVTVRDSRYKEPMTYRRSSFFEVKAVAGTLHLSYGKHQLFGILEAARNSDGAKAGRANVTFITTANTIIGADVIAFASKHGISVHQSVAFQWGDGNNVVFSPTVELTPGTSLSIPTPSIFAWPRSLNFRR
jgi:RHS repeat-associated protein